MPKAHLSGPGHVAWRAASDRMHTLCVEAAGTILISARSPGTVR